MTKASVWAVSASLAGIAVPTLVDILLHIARVYPPMPQPLTEGWPSWRSRQWRSRPCCP